MDSQTELEKIFLSYTRILEKLKINNIKTKGGKEITMKDLRQAIDIMDKKHPTCRWKNFSSKCDKKYYIVTEGFYWIMFVYFQIEKSTIDADIEFFELRIKQYEELLNVSFKNFWKNDMYVYELPEYFCKTKGTIKNNIIKMNKQTNKIYIYLENGEKKISKEGVEWLAKNCFKRKYLGLLEEYKMELTEIYIDRGYPYDVF